MCVRERCHQGCHLHPEDVQCSLDEIPPEFVIKVTREQQEGDVGGRFLSLLLSMRGGKHMDYPSRKGSLKERFSVFGTVTGKMRLFLLLMNIP